MDYPASVPLQLPTSDDDVDPLFRAAPGEPGGLLAYWHAAKAAAASAKAKLARRGPTPAPTRWATPAVTEDPLAPGLPEFATRGPYARLDTPSTATAGAPGGAVGPPGRPAGLFATAPPFGLGTKNISADDIPPAPMPLTRGGKSSTPAPTPAPPAKTKKPKSTTTGGAKSTTTGGFPKGPHTGDLVMRLPVDDLAKKGAGVWEGKVTWKKSSLATFQGERVLRVFMKKGSGTGSMPHPEASGVSVSCQNRAVKGQTAVVVAFDLYFDPAAWHWSKGGKIGGLFVGPGVASGYRHSDDGASHRMMWQREGGAISYIYPPAKLKQADPDLKPDGHGVGYFGKDKFPPGFLRPGQWNRVEIGVKINSFTGGKPNPDGMSQLTINGVSGVLDNVRWAKSPDLKIEKFENNVFMGGPDPAVVDSVLYMKNFEIYSWKD